MNQHLLGNPKLTVKTHVNEVKAGITHLVDSVSIWKSRNDYGKRCHCGNARWRKLYIKYFEPNKHGHPVVMSADTYGKIISLKSQILGALWPTLGAIPTSSFTPKESPDPGFWVPNDYVVVKVALRGSDKSKGVLSPWSKREAEDYYEVIEWAAKQPWSNGIFANGVSYLAVTQWWVASLDPPHLKDNDSLGRIK
ncbi:CocE/NonD family hydrolase [Staphylococcus aureus]